MCHLALFLPVLGLPLLWLLPLSLGVPLYLLTLVLSAGIYYLTIAAMRRPVMIGPEHIIGSRAIVTEFQDDLLWVRLDSERWRATCVEPLQPGDSVEVIGRDGSRLLVKRAE